MRCPFSPGVASTHTASVSLGEHNDKHCDTRKIVEVFRGCYWWTREVKNEPISCTLYIVLERAHRRTGQWCTVVRNWWLHDIACHLIRFLWFRMQYRLWTVHRKVFGFRGSIPEADRMCLYPAGLKLPPWDSHDFYPPPRATWYWVLHGLGSGYMTVVRRCIVAHCSISNWTVLRDPSVYSEQHTTQFR